jgi:SAP domain.
MLFDFFKKNKKTVSEPEVSEEEFNEALAGYIASNITVGPVESEIIIPDFQGDYAKAIFLWANSKKSQIKDNDDYPRYILYGCGIQNASDYHRELINEGYLQEDGFEVSLESLKQTELKEIASDLGVATSGKKADIAKRIANSGKADYLKCQMPMTYSLSETGKSFVQENDDCIQLHRHKTWMIDWSEYKKIKQKLPEGTFYYVCNEILLDRAAADKRIFGRIEYLNLSKLEDEFGDARRALRYLLQVLYIDVSGVMGHDSYAYYKQGIYDKKMLKETFISNVMLAPGIIDLIKKHKDHYEANIIDTLYTWKLPTMICEKPLFEDIVNSIFDGTFNNQFYSEQLKVRYEKFVDSL